MIGHDQHAVITTQVFQGRAPELQIVLSTLIQKREEWIMVADGSALGLQQINDRQGWGFAKVVYILLVGDAQNKHARTIYGFVSAVQSGRYGPHHMTRHRRVDLAGEFDKSQLEIPFLRFPGKVERIDRNTVPAKTGTRVKR